MGNKSPRSTPGTSGGLASTTPTTTTAAGAEAGASSNTPYYYNQSDIINILSTYLQSRGMAMSDAYQVATVVAGQGVERLRDMAETWDRERMKNELGEQIKGMLTQTLALDAVKAWWANPTTSLDASRDITQGSGSVVKKSTLAPFLHTSTKEPVAVCKGHSKAIMCVEFSHDGDLMFSAGSDALIGVWSVPSGERRQLLTAHASGVVCVAASPVENILASASSRELRVWGFEDGVFSAGLLIPGAESVLCLRFHSHGDIVAAGDANGSITIRGVGNGWATLRSIKVHDGPIRALAFRAVAMGDASSPSSPEILAACLKRVIKVVDTSVRSGRGVSEIVLSRSFKVSDVVSSLEHGIIACSWDGSLVVWDEKKQSPKASLSNTHEGSAVTCLSVYESLLATGGKDSCVRVWSLPNLSRVAVLSHGSNVMAVCFHPHDGEWLGVGCVYVGELQLWAASGA